MGILLENTAAEIIFYGWIVTWILYNFITKNYESWKKKGVPYVGGVFPFGTLWDVILGQKNVGEGFERCYKQMKDERYFGVITVRSPTLVVNDLDLIKQILVKDFSHFTDRNRLLESQKKEYIINHLFNMTGQDWRNMRLTLAPTFTSGKMKMMFILLEECSNQLQKYLETQVDTSAEVDVKDVLARFTMNTIGSCAFGIDINCFSDRNCEFYTLGTQILLPTFSRMVRRFLYSLFPYLVLVYIPPMTNIEVTRFFTKIIDDTIKYREKHDVHRNDFLDLLIKIRQNKSPLNYDEKSNGLENDEYMNNQKFNKKPELTLEEITAQSFVFFIAGFETASSTASFCLYHLACDQEVQDKLFTEITEVLAKHGGKTTYQALQEMTYMDQVINETLRLYPSLSVLERTCTQNYKIPDSDLTLEKGSKVIIPISAIHHDSKYYPEPSKFDPERFSLENKRLRHPCAHLPFGEGPRMCIGMRFGLMQTKVALTTMIYNYHFDKTPALEIPIKINSKSVVTLPEKPVLLRTTKRTVCSN